MRLLHAASLAGLLLLAGCSTTSQSSNSTEKTVTLKRPSGQDLTGIENNFRDSTTLAVGQNLTVRMPGNPSESFSWKLASGDTNLLKPLGAAAFEPDGSGLSDKGGNFVLRYQAVAAGNTTLNFIYQSSAAVLDARVKRFALTVTIK